MLYDSTTWSPRHEKIRVSSTVMIQGRESGRLSRKLGVETKHGLTKGDVFKVHVVQNMSQPVAEEATGF